MHHVRLVKIVKLYHVHRKRSRLSLNLQAGCGHPCHALLVGNLACSVHWLHMFAH